MELPNQAQNVTILLVSNMLAVKWLETNAGTTEQELAVPTPEQLSRVSISRRLDLFKTTCKILRILKEMERIWARQRLPPGFRALMEGAMRHMSRNTQAFRYFQLDKGQGAYKRAFLVHMKAVTTAVKRVAGMPCTTE